MLLHSSPNRQTICQLEPYLAASTGWKQIPQPPLISILHALLIQSIGRLEFSSLHYQSDWTLVALIQHQQAPVHNYLWLKLCRRHSPPGSHLPPQQALGPSGPWQSAGGMPQSLLNTHTLKCLPFSKNKKADNHYERTAPHQTALQQHTVQEEEKNTRRSEFIFTRLFHGS